jgi:hypothetical protein
MTVILIEQKAVYSHSNFSQVHRATYGPRVTHLRPMTLGVYMHAAVQQRSSRSVKCMVNRYAWMAKRELCLAWTFED